MRKNWPNDCSAAIEYDAQLNHLEWLARNELYGKKYAWNRAKELEQSSEQMWRGICDDLKDRMTNNTTNEPPEGSASIAELG